MRRLRGLQRTLLFLFFAMNIVAVKTFSDQNQSPARVGMIELLANRDRFDGKLVTLIGFLTIDTQKKHAATAFLVLHEEDAKNLLPNGVEVIANEQMLRNHEKLNGMYAMISGLVHLVPAEKGSAIVIKDVRGCKVWSDPRRRPVTLSGEPPK
jgi:hypothetical protein